MPESGRGSSSRIELWESPGGISEKYFRHGSKLALVSVLAKRAYSAMTTSEYPLT